jgi:hypothetical protein
MDAEAALNHVGRLIDLAFVLKRIEATDRAIKLAEGIGQRTLSPTQSAILNYYLSNAWANGRQLRPSGAHDDWKWEQPQIEKQIIYLRRAYASKAFPDLDALRRCQILTNLGNLLNTVGRFWRLSPIGAKRSPFVLHLAWLWATGATG